MLEEGVSDHRHSMTVKALPGSSLEMVKTKFFFHLLVSLLANPTRLDGGCQDAQVGLRRQTYSYATVARSISHMGNVGLQGLRE